MRKYSLLLVIVFILPFMMGCTQTELTGVWYVAEGVGFAGYDRAKRSNDVVLVKGVKGQQNILCMRRGSNKIWGPSSNLKDKSGLGFWDYIEQNRKIQIYESVGVAKYSKYKFEMTSEVKLQWEKYEAWMGKKYSTQTDYIMYEHLLRRKAQINEAVSELKQEKYMFKHRND